ncbi:hypothetical protein D1872_253930 [compost metagenome]
MVTFSPLPFVAVSAEFVDGVELPGFEAFGFVLFPPHAASTDIIKSVAEIPAKTRFIPFILFILATPFFSFSGFL